MREIKRRNALRLAAIALLVILVFAAAAALYLRVRTYAPMSEALEALSQINVRQEKRVIIVDPPGEALASLVFYQGGLVQTESYLVLARMLAAQGVRVFLPRMPLQLAILNTKVFDRIYNQYYDGGPWYIGGHSLGGATAAIYTAGSSGRVSGLVLLAAYPSNSSDLSGLHLPVLSITAGNDQIMNRQRYADTRKLLPDDAVFRDISGGNHAGFGYYGAQSGDGKATIPREEQHRITVLWMMEFISSGGR